MIVTYGRRRCGKSRLLKEILKEGDIYYVATQSDALVQRAQLADAIALKVSGFNDVRYPNWDALFHNLDIRLDRRITLCIDEFPYLAKGSTSLPSIYLDQNPKRKFHLVLCGSSQQMMHSLVLDQSAPLYGRADEIIKVNPMNAGWITKALKVSPIRAIEEYSTWGGVPRYWELRSELRNYEEAVKVLVLDRLGILHEEPARLFMDDMRESIQATSIMTLVGNGAHKMSEIAARLNKPATHLSRPLQKLLELGYLTREIPFGANERSNKKSLYKIKDPYLNFYFTFVVPNLSMLALDKIDLVYRKITKRLKYYQADAWENLCREAVPFMSFKGKTFNRAFRWWGNNTLQNQMEIDVVAESTDKKFLLIGECQWRIKTKTSDAIKNLLNKIHHFPNPKNKEIIAVLFLKRKPNSDKSEVVIVTPKLVLQSLRND